MHVVPLFQCCGCNFTHVECTHPAPLPLCPPRQAILADPGDATQMRLLYANKTPGGGWDVPRRALGRCSVCAGACMQQGSLPCRDWGFGLAPPCREWGFGLAPPPHHTRISSAPPPATSPSSATPSSLTSISSAPPLRHPPSCPHLLHTPPPPPTTSARHPAQASAG